MCVVFAYKWTTTDNSHASQNHTVSCFSLSTPSLHSLETRISNFVCRKTHPEIFSTKAEAEATGSIFAAQIRTQGTQSLIPKNQGTSLSAILKIYRHHKVSSMQGAHQRIAIVVYRAFEEKFGNVPMDLFRRLNWKNGSILGASLPLLQLPIIVMFACSGDGLTKNN